MKNFKNINKSICGNYNQFQLKKYYRQLIKTELSKPSIFNHFISRMSRTNMKLKQDESFKEYRYNTKKGWFHSVYYYSVNLFPP